MEHAPFVKMAETLFMWYEIHLVAHFFKTP